MGMDAVESPTPVEREGDEGNKNRAVAKGDARNIPDMIISATTMTVTQRRRRHDNMTFCRLTRRLT